MKETPNCEIEIFGKSPIYKMSTKPAYLDEEARTIRTEQDIQNYKKTSIWFIIFGRWMPMLMIAYLFVQNSTTSMLYSTLFAISASLYLIYSAIYYFFGKRVTFISLLPIPLIYLYFSFSGTDLIDAKTLYTSFNTIFLNLVSFGFLHLFITEIVNNDEKNWLTTSPIHAYIRIKNPKYNLKMSRLIFSAILVVFATYGIENFQKAKAQNEAKIESYKPYEQERAELAKWIEKRDAKLLEIRLAKLDKQADALGLAHFHRNDDSIVKYEELEVSEGTDLYNAETGKFIEKYQKERVVVKSWVKPFNCPEREDRRGDFLYWHFWNDYPKKDYVIVSCTSPAN